MKKLLQLIVIASVLASGVSLAGGSNELDPDGGFTMPIEFLQDFTYLF